MQDVAAQRTNYPSKVWESWWDGYDPDGPDDQEFFQGLRPEVVPAKRAELTAMLKLQSKGIDFVDRTLSRCREKGMSPWISNITIKYDDLAQTLRRIVLHLAGGYPLKELFARVLSHLRNPLAVPT